MTKLKEVPKGKVYYKERYLEVFKKNKKILKYTDKDKIRVNYATNEFLVVSKDNKEITIHIVETRLDYSEVIEYMIVKSKLYINKDTNHVLGKNLQYLYFYHHQLKDIFEFPWLHQYEFGQLFDVNLKDRLELVKSLFLKEFKSDREFYDKLCKLHGISENNYQYIKKIYDRDTLENLSLFDNASVGLKLIRNHFKPRSLFDEYCQFLRIFNLKSPCKSTEEVLSHYNSLKYKFTELLIL